MKALIPGSFDPITIGHLDLIKRAADIFDTIIIGIFVNPQKNYTFSLEKRKKMIIEATKELQNVSVITDNGYVVDYCKQHGIKVLVKGVRSVSDYEYELEMADFNKKRNPDIETLLLPAYDDMASISSTYVRTLIQKGDDISKLVPPAVLNEINSK